MDDPTMASEAERVAAQVCAQWPFINKGEFIEFYYSLYGITAAEGAVRVSLWVLQRVIEHKMTM